MSKKIKSPDKIAGAKAEIMTKEETADLLRVSRSKLDELMRDQELPYYKLGQGKNTSVRFIKSEIIEWLKNFRQN